MEFLNFNSVKLLPNAKASAAFSADSGSVFREQNDIAPVVIDDRLSYMPCGADNQMPYEILNLIESDETLATCQIFNAEVCYGSGFPADTRTLQQCVAMRELLASLKERFPKAVIYGHRDFARKACPCFDAAKEYAFIEP